MFLRFPLHTALPEVSLPKNTNHIPTSQPTRSEKHDHLPIKMRNSQDTEHSCVMELSFTINELPFDVVASAKVPKDWLTDGGNVNKCWLPRVRDRQKFVDAKNYHFDGTACQSDGWFYFRFDYVEFWLCVLVLESDCRWGENLRKLCEYFGINYTLVDSILFILHHFNRTLCVIWVLFHMPFANVWI